MNYNSRIAAILKKAEEDIAAIRAEEKANRSWEGMKALIVAVAVNALKGYRAEEAKQRADEYQEPEDEYQEPEVVDEDEEVDEPVREEKSTRGKYPNLYDDLYVLDIETLKQIKKVATRTNANDLKNACRTVLRHKGVNC